MSRPERSGKNAVDVVAPIPGVTAELPVDNTDKLAARARSPSTPRRASALASKTRTSMPSTSTAWLTLMLTPPSVTSTAGSAVIEAPRAVASTTRRAVGPPSGVMSIVSSPSTGKALLSGSVALAMPSPPTSTLIPPTANTPVALAPVGVMTTVLAPSTVAMTSTVVLTPTVTGRPSEMLVTSAARADEFMKVRTSAKIARAPRPADCLSLTFGLPTKTLQQLFKSAALEGRLQPILDVTTHRFERRIRRRQHCRDPQQRQPVAHNNGPNDGAYRRREDSFSKGAVVGIGSDRADTARRQPFGAVACLGKLREGFSGVDTLTQRFRFQLGAGFVAADGNEDPFGLTTLR